MSKQIYGVEVTFKDGGLVAGANLLDTKAFSMYVLPSLANLSIVVLFGPRSKSPKWSSYLTILRAKFSRPRRYGNHKARSSA